MSFDIYCNKSEQESMLSLLNDCHVLVASTTSIMCTFDAELGKKVYHVDWPGHLHEFFFSCLPSNNQGSREFNL